MVMFKWFYNWQKLVRKSRDFMWVIFILLLQEFYLTFIITGRANTHQNFLRSFSVISNHHQLRIQCNAWKLCRWAAFQIHQQICADQNDRHDGSSRNHWRSNAWYRSKKSCLLDHGPRLMNLLRLILLINRGMRCQAPIELEKVLVMTLWLYSAAPYQCLVWSQDSRIGWLFGKF